MQLRIAPSAPVRLSIWTPSCPVEGIRIAGRSTQGVIVFDTAEDEHVVSVEHIGDDGENGENGNGS